MPKPKCGRGHWFTPDNTKEYNGKRYCVQCMKEKAARWEEKVKKDPQKAKERAERKLETQRLRRGTKKKRS